MRILCCCFIGLLASNCLRGQEMIPVDVSALKSVNVIFNAPVKYCDAGHDKVEFSISDNVVKLKARVPNTEETNLSVITSDNKCYAFLLLYRDQPRLMFVYPDPAKAKEIPAKNIAKPEAATPVVPPVAVVPPVTENAVAVEPPKTVAVNPVKNIPKVSVPKTDKKAEPVVEKKVEKKSEPVKPEKAIYTKPEFIDEKALSIKSETLLSSKQHLFDAGMVKKQMVFQIAHVAADPYYLYVSVLVRNNSKNDYQIDFTNFQVMERNGVFEFDRGDLKKPVFIYNKQDKYGKGKWSKQVFVFDKFTVGSEDLLRIETAEADGDRFLCVDLKASIVNEPIVIK